MLTSWDDFPIHQIAEPIRHVGTSDRNFYDRYYFNLHASSDELFMIMGMGQYPNLGTHDAFVCVRYEDTHHVVRASKVLVRSDGPERGAASGSRCVEPLQKLRFVCEPTEHTLACDLTLGGWDPGVRRSRASSSAARVGCSSTRSGSRRPEPGRAGSTSTVQRIEVTPDRFKGTRDRSWGIRPGR